VENRNSYVVVGAVTLALLLGLLGFILWLSNYSRDVTKEYDIFFQQSVGGLATGSAVTFSGVPVGQVRRIALMPESPEFVRVRIEVEESVPILAGTTAAIQGVGFTGVSQIQLTGAIRGAEQLTTPGPYGVPVIPSTTSGFSAILDNAPQLIERLSVLSLRLSELFDDTNRDSIASILANVDKTTEALAASSPELKATIAETRQAIAAVRQAADSLDAAGRSADRLISDEGAPMVSDLRKTIASADQALQRIDRLALAAEPGVQTLSRETIPEITQLTRDLRDISQSLGAVATRLDQDPAGALLGGRQLPDYDPERAGRK
jgi:phospholipid/cholesterol/gamma-HCH transport system substrate-binding protein